MSTLSPTDMVVVSAQLLTLIALIVYTWKTWTMASATRESARTSERTLQEMRNAREQEFAPYVVVFFSIPYGDVLMELVVKNIGRMPARDVRISFSPPLQNTHDGLKANQMALIEHGIQSLPPDHEIKTFFDTTLNYFSKSRGLPMRYCVSASWYSINAERRFTSQWDIDLSCHADRRYVRPNDLNVLVRECEKMRKSLDALSQDIHRVYTVLDNPAHLPTGLCLSLPKSAEEWEHSILGVLRTLHGFWEDVYRKEEDFLVNPLFQQVRTLLRGLSMDLLVLTAHYPDGVPPDRVGALNTLARDVLSLAYTRFYVDGGFSQKKFNELGDGIASQIEKISVAERTPSSQAETS